MTIFLAAGVFCGCQGSSDRAAVVRAVTAEDEPWVRELSISDERRALAVMDSTRTADVASAKLTTGPPRGRWSDVPDAVRLAATEVEMAIVTKEFADDQWLFVLRTIEDTPAELRVTKTGDARVWSAEASVGLFKSATSRRDQLLNAFASKMQALSKKRKFE